MQTFPRRPVPLSRRRGVLVLAVASMLLLAGCAQSEPKAAPAPSPTVKPLFATDADALAAATKAYAEFLQTSDEILADGGQRPERIRSVATDEVANEETDGYKKFASLGYHIVGSTTIDSQKLERYDVGLADGKEAIFIYLCADSSGVDVVDRADKSVVSPSREARTPFEVSIIPKSRDPLQLVVASKRVWDGKSFCK